jgi:hypothetical protein
MFIMERKVLMTLRMKAFAAVVMLHKSFWVSNRRPSLVRDL